MGLTQNAQKIGEDAMCIALKMAAYNGPEWIVDTCGPSLKKFRDRVNSNVDLTDKALFMDLIFALGVASVLAVIGHKVESEAARRN